MGRSRKAGRQLCDVGVLHFQKVSDRNTALWCSDFTPSPTKSVRGGVCLNTSDPTASALVSDVYYGRERATWNNLDGADLVFLPRP